MIETIFSNIKWWNQYQIEKMIWDELNWIESRWEKRTLDEMKQNEMRLDLIKWSEMKWDQKRNLRWSEKLKIKDWKSMAVKIQNNSFK